jgi:hypothetical protein
LGRPMFRQVPTARDFPPREMVSLEHLHRATAKTAYGKIFGTRVFNLMGPTNFAVGAWRKC